MEIRVGTSGYGYKEWKGIFYPEKIPAKEMLGFYAERLGAVEINYTFYHQPTEKVLVSWAAQVPEDFSFALKAPQVITHRKRLRNAEAEIEYFFRTVAALGRKMGPALFQLPASFHADRAVLADFLALIPEGRSCAFEFRCRSWLAPEILALLGDKGCSLCIADTDEAPADALTGTASWGYLRLRRSAYPDAELARWLARILAQGWEKAFVFFKHEEEGKGPDAALRFRDLAASREQ